MSVSVEQNISSAKRRKVIQIKIMTVSCINKPIAYRYYTVIGKYREVKNHLVYFGIAVAAHAQQPLPQGIQQLQRTQKSLSLTSLSIEITFFGAYSSGKSFLGP